MSDDAQDLQQSVVSAVKKLLPKFVEQVVTNSLELLTPEVRLDEKKVSRITGLPISTLQKMRGKSSSLRFEKRGWRVFYRYGDVLEWMESQRVRSVADAYQRGLARPRRKNKTE